MEVAQSHKAGWKINQDEEGSYRYIKNLKSDVTINEKYQHKIRRRKIFPRSTSLVKIAFFSFMFSFSLLSCCIFTSH